MKRQDVKKINQEARVIARIVAKKYNPEKIILFGSAARGNIHKYSDIDICIIKNTKLPLHKRICKVYNFIDNVDWEYGVEPIVFTPKEFNEKKKCGNYFIRNIVKDGKILYER